MNPRSLILAALGLLAGGCAETPPPTSADDGDPMPANSKKDGPHTAASTAVATFALG